jgi:hypothetical protein
MDASTTKVTRPFRPSFEAAGSRRKARRNLSRLRRLVLFAIACCKALLWALQDARSREAASVMARYRYLDARPIKSKEN